MAVGLSNDETVMVCLACHMHFETFFICKPVCKFKCEVKLYFIAVVYNYQDTREGLARDLATLVDFVFAMKDKLQHVNETSYTHYKLRAGTL